MWKSFYYDIKKKFSVGKHYSGRRLMAPADAGMQMKEKYYRDMEMEHEQYDIFLHDIRHMLRTIFALSKEGDCEKISSIVAGIGTSLGNIETSNICSHKVLNALLTERIGYANDIGITLETDINEPLYFQGINDIDLITLMGNLLDNAIEAERKADKQEGIQCYISMSKDSWHIVIRIENSYNERQTGMEKVRSRITRIGHKHGIGLQSIEKVVRKYGGIMSKVGDNGRYCALVIIPMQSETNDTEESTIA